MHRRASWEKVLAQCGGALGAYNQAMQQAAQARAESEQEMMEDQEKFDRYCRRYLGALHPVPACSEAEDLYEKAQEIVEELGSEMEQVEMDAQAFKEGCNRFGNTPIEEEEEKGSFEKFAENCERGDDIYAEMLKKSGRKYGDSFGERQGKSYGNDGEVKKR